MPEVHGFEPELTTVLAETCPGRVTELVEIDADRTWMPRRGHSAARVEPPDPDLWETILPRYAELQIAVTPRADDLLALGVPDERLAAIPDKVEALLGDDDTLMLGQSAELTADQRDELRRRLPELRALVEELEAFGVPETIQHDDLHDGQVFVRDGHIRILDWGDSCISHPFHTLTVTPRTSPGGTSSSRAPDSCSGSETPTSSRSARPRRQPIWRIEPALSAGRSPGTGTSQRPLPASAIQRTPRACRTVSASTSKPGRSDLEVSA